MNGGLSEMGWRLGERRPRNGSQLLIDPFQHRNFGDGRLNPHILGRLQLDPAFPSRPLLVEHRSPSPNRLS